jgi:hypothetical protein
MVAELGGERQKVQIFCLRSEDSVRGALKRWTWRKAGMAEEASEGPLRTVTGRALGVGYRHDSQAALRASAGRRRGLQSGENGASVARLSQFVHRPSADGTGRGGAGGEPDSLVVRVAGVVGDAGRMAGAEPPGFSARRLRLGNGAGHGRS